MVNKKKELIATRGKTKLYYTHTVETSTETVVFGIVEKDGVETKVNLQSALRLGYWTPVESKKDKTTE
jgi:hypothetical protein